MERPNVLILMSDEHRYDVCGFAQNTVVRTPNLDRLAEGAVIFDNAYTPSPVDQKYGFALRCVKNK